MSQFISSRRRSLADREPTWRRCQNTKKFSLAHTLAFHCHGLRNLAQFTLHLGILGGTRLRGVCKPGRKAFTHSQAEKRCGLDIRGRRGRAVSLCQSLVKAPSFICGFIFGHCPGHDRGCYGVSTQQSSPSLAGTTLVRRCEGERSEF